MDIRLRVFTGDTPAVLQCLLQQRAANRLAPVSCDSWNYFGILMGNYSLIIWILTGQ
jgi:hypothetical protein